MVGDTSTAGSSSMKFVGANLMDVVEVETCVAELLHVDDDDADVDVVYVAVTLVVAETVVVGTCVAELLLDVDVVAVTELVVVATTTGAGSMKFAGASKLVDVVDVETCASMLK